MQIPGLTQMRVDAIWDTICFMGAGGEIIKTRDVIAMLVKYDGDMGAPKTWADSWGKFHIWALANPNQFYGPASRLTKVASGRYKLVTGSSFNDLPESI